MKIPSLVAAACAVASVSTLSAASDSWIVGADGAYNDPLNWTGGNVPNGAADTATVEGAGSIVAFNDTVTLSTLNLATSTTGATPIFNQNGGTLTVATLAFGGGGGSRNPTYNLNGGTLDVTTSFTWGSGSNARFNVSAGTVNYGGTNFFSIGTASGANGAIEMTGGTFNANSVTNLRLGGSNNADGSLVLSNNAIFNLNADGVAYLGNNGGSGYITMSGTSELNAANTIISVGQFGNTSGNEGVVTMNGGTLRAERIALGGDNAGSSIVGIINLNGGVIETAQIRSETAGTSTTDVVHANGGTIRVTTDAVRNLDYFQNAYIDLQAGGLNFDTNGNATAFVAGTTIAGTGNLVKQGAGSLTVFGSKTYTGDTVIEGGSIVLGNADVFDNASDLVLDGGALVLADFSEAFSTLNLESTSTIDFGTLLGGANTLTFADSSAVAWSGSLILTNFNVGEDALNFSSATGLTIGQLNAISLAGYNATGLDGLGNVVFTAVPEPAEISLAIVGGLGLLAFARRRRRAARA